MTVLKFTLPRPPSTNRLYSNVLGHGRVLTKHHRKWRKLAMQQIMIQRCDKNIKKIAGPYHLAIIVERGDIDLGNCEKAVSDCLEKMHVIDNDRKAESIFQRWGDVQGCEVTVVSALPNRFASVRYDEQ